MKLNRQCKYCNKVIKSKQPLTDEDICFNCYKKRTDVRWFREQLKPLIDFYNERKKKQ